MLLYAYARGQRSSRAIERGCVEDVAYRVIAANEVPDHTTIARFRQRHESALAGLFGEVLGLCAEAGLAKVGVIAIDGTKVYANASRDATRDYEQIAKEILEQADRVDREEDEQFDEARGDELPPELQTEQGRRGWLREAKRRLDAKRAAEARPIPKSRPARLVESRRRPEEELAVERAANRDYEAYRARGVDKAGRGLGMPPRAFEPPITPAGKVNVTDPDSQLVHAMRGWIQGYNAQAAVNEAQIVLAAEVTTTSPDFGQLEPMLTAAESELQSASVMDTPTVVVADRLLAPGADGADRQPRHPGPDPTRLKQTQRHPPRLGRRPLRVHATRPRRRHRQSALPQTPRHDRARVRAHQIQPAHGLLPTAREIGGTLGMGPNHRHPQPPEALHPPTSARNRLSGPRGPRRRHRRPPTIAAHPAEPRPGHALRNSLTRERH